MKKLAVLTAVLFLFGVAGFAAADNGGQDPSLQANGNDLVKAGGAAANDGSTAVAVKDNLNGNTLMSNNPSTETSTETSTKTVTVTKAEDGSQLGTTNTSTKNDESFNTKNVNVTKAEDGSQLGTTNTSTKNDESFNTKNVIGTGNETEVSAEKGSTAVSAVNGNATLTPTDARNIHVPGETVTNAANSSVNNSNNKTNSDQHDSNNTNSFQDYKAEEGGQLAIGGGSNTMNKAEDGGMLATGGSNYSVDAEKGAAATVNGNASVDSRDQSTHTNVEAQAEAGSLSAINTTGAVTLDKSTNISVSNVGLALQNSDLSGEVKDNKLEVGGPKAVSVTKGGSAKSGSAESGEAKSGEAETGKAVSVAKSKSGAVANATSGSDGFVPLSVSQDSHDGNKDPQADPSSPATATADSKSKSGSTATSGAAGSGAAGSGTAGSGAATGGAAAGSTVSATNAFYTGANSFGGTVNFNGIGGFNVNSGVNSLNQSSINVNAVVGGAVAGK